MSQGRDMGHPSFGHSNYDSVLMALADVEADDLPWLGDYAEGGGRTDDFGGLGIGVNVPSYWDKLIDDKGDGQGSVVR